jgi:hypothetical protein
MRTPLRRWHSRTAGSLVVLILGCTRHPAPVEPPTPSAIPVAKASSNEAKPTHGSPPKAPIEVALELARSWCEAGGEQFAAPGNDPDDYPPPLASCDDVESSITNQDTAGSVSTSILVIDAFGYETREVLLYQTDSGDHRVELNHDYEDESGEGGVYYRSYQTIELRDVYGDPTPEWIATVTITGGDSFEADRCYSHHVTDTALILCTVAASRLRCLAVGVENYEQIAPRDADELYDCEDPVTGEPTTLSGYVTEARVERGAVVFTRQSDPTMDDPEDPPYEGRVSLDTLLDEHEINAED